MLFALGFLQNQNVIHADLKPENLLLKKGVKINLSYALLSIPDKYRDAYTGIKLSHFFY